MDSRVCVCVMDVVGCLWFVCSWVGLWCYFWYKDDYVWVGWGVGWCVGREFVVLNFNVIYVLCRWWFGWRFGWI